MFTDMSRRTAQRASRDREARRLGNGHRDSKVEPGSCHLSSVRRTHIAQQAAGKFHHGATAAQRRERTRQGPGVYFRKVPLSVIGPYREGEIFGFDAESRGDAGLVAARIEPDPAFLIA